MRRGWRRVVIGSSKARTATFTRLVEGNGQDGWILQDAALLNAWKTSPVICLVDVSRNSMNGLKTQHQNPGHNAQQAELLQRRLAGRFG